MYDRLIVLARYDNFSEANQDAEFLKSEEIPCIIESLTTQQQTSDSSPRGKVLLKVPAEHEAHARNILEIDDPWYSQTTRKPISQQYMLIGMVVGLIGLFTSLGTMASTQLSSRWLYYILTIAGGLIFIKGAWDVRNGE